MEQIAYFNRKIYQMKANLNRYTILDTLYEAGSSDTLNQVSFLIQSIEGIINEDATNQQNYIDNTLFEIATLLDDIKASLNEVVSTDVFIFIMNEDLASIGRINQKLNILKNNTSSLIKATIIIEEQASLIVSKYLAQVKKALIEGHFDEALSVYNELGLDQYLVSSNETLADWQNIYKRIGRVLKMIKDLPPSILDANASFVSGMLLRMVK